MRCLFLCIACAPQAVPQLNIQRDMDTDMGSEFFETRQAFLSLCQGNHYQVSHSTASTAMCHHLLLALVSVMSIAEQTGH